MRACAELVGAYALVVLADDKLVAVRDPMGLKPLCVGTLGGDIVFASETCALDALGATVIRDLSPGEVVTVDEGLNMKASFCPRRTGVRVIFEYVYLARGDSRIDGVNVYDARYECGKMLAERFKIDADVVAGVPDSAIVSARGYSEVSGVPYVDALSKNRYIGRTFIQPSQSMRREQREDKAERDALEHRGSDLFSQTTR